MSECDNCRRVFGEESPGVTTVKELYLCERCIGKLADYDMLLVQAKSYERAMLRLSNANDDEEIGAIENIEKTLDEWQDRQLVTK